MRKNKIQCLIIPCSFTILCMHVMAAQSEWSCYFHISHDLHHPAGSLHDRLSNPRITEEPFRNKFQTSSVGTSRIPSSTCTLLFIKYIPGTHPYHFCIICGLEFFRSVAWLLTCSWIKQPLFKQGILISSAWPFYKPVQADKSQILTQSTDSFCSVY